MTTRRNRARAFRSGASTLLAGAFVFAAVESASAQSGFWQLFAPRAAPAPAPQPQAAKSRPARRDLPTPKLSLRGPRILPEAAQGPITIVVSTDRQRLTVYDGDKSVAETTVSTGVKDHPTPHGVFAVIEKQIFHRSTIYDDAPMPYMQRLTWSGIALHQGHVTGRPASHGCVRLPQEFARDLFRFTRRGMRVIISREDVKPAPLVGFAQIVQAPARRYVMGDAVQQALVPGEIEPPHATVGQAQVGAARDIVSAAPISALINRKTGKLYVRRDFRPLFEVPVTIDEPNQPIGAHLLVAQPASGERRLAWSAVSVPSRTREALLSGANGRGASDFQAPALGYQPNAEEALKRIHLAPGTAARLATLLGPGASLIISDDGARGKESWDGTNFIALVE